MNLRPLIQALTLSVVSFVVVLPLASVGCGQDVAGCDQACASGSSAACGGECMAAQDACTQSDDLGDFQALLTCVTNADGFLDPLPVLCVPESNAVKANCTGTPPVDGGQ